MNIVIFQQKRVQLDCAVIKSGTLPVTITLVYTI